MTDIRYEELKDIPIGTHIKIIPIDKLSDDNEELNDIKVDDIVNDRIWGTSILYNLSETCDGYVYPFEWIKDYIIP